MQTGLIVDFRTKEVLRDKFADGSFPLLYPQHIKHGKVVWPIDDVDVMIGGFPRQSFSTVNPTKDPNDSRANLYREVVRFLQEKRPGFFICENVKGLMTLQKGEILRKIVRELAEVGYKVLYSLVRAVEFGVPQKRERMIIAGVRSDLNVQYEFPGPILETSAYIPVSRAIDSLALDDKKYYFSARAVAGMKNAKNNMKRGLWQDLDQPCLTITSHLAKTSINSRDPVLLVDPQKELYRRPVNNFLPICDFLPSRAQDFPSNDSACFLWSGEQY